MQQAADAIGAAPTADYGHPHGERTQRGGVFFSRNDLTMATRTRPAPAPPADEDPADTAADPPPAPSPISRLTAATTWSAPGDPRHGGPLTSTSQPAA